MNRPRIEVQHFIANQITRQYGPDQTRDLLGVNYWHRFPPDTEFPRVIRQIDLYTRLYLRGAKPTEFEVWVRRAAGRGRNPPDAARHGPYLVPFRPDQTVLDHAFRLHNVSLPGEGLYVVRLVRPGHGSRADQSVGFAKTFFEVTRSL